MDAVLHSTHCSLLPTCVWVFQDKIIIIIIYNILIHRAYIITIVNLFFNIKYFTISNCKNDDNNCINFNI